MTSLDVLVCAPVGRDAHLIQRTLETEGFSTRACQTIDELCTNIDSAGVIVISDQVFAHPSALPQFADAIKGQPVWSDLPVLILTAGGPPNTRSRFAFRQLQPIGTFTLLERPLRPFTLITSVRSALHARRQQYEIRDYVRKLETNQQQLSQSQERYRALAEQISDGIFVVDTQGRYVDGNRAAADMLGRTLDELFSFSIPDVVAPHHIAELPAEFEKLSAGQTVRGDWLFRRKNGSTFLGELIARQLPDGRYQGIVRDVTEHRRAEEALRESEARFRTMADVSPVIIWVTDVSGNIEFINQAYRTFCGVTDEDVQHDRWQLVVHPQDAEKYVGEFFRCIRERKSFSAQCRIRRADGVWRWIASYGAVRFSAAGDFLGHVGSSPDITDLMEVQQALLESEERFRTLADNISQLVWMAHPDGHVHWFNQRWYEFTGTTLAQMQGRGWHKVCHPGHLNRVMTHFDHCLEHATAWEDTFPLRAASGEYRWFLSRALPLRDDAGNIVRWFGTNTDITAQLETEKELRRANQDLEQFAYSASHDLQEPLRNVAIYSQLLQKQYGTKVEGQASLFLDHIVNGAHRLATLVNDLLAYTRAGADDDQPVEVTSGETVLDHVLTNLAQTIKATHAVVTWDPLPPVYIRAIHLELLLQNLISNSLKYRKENEPPVVHVTAELQDAFWRFSVSDNGIGIAPQYCEKVFGVFKRLHSSDRKYSGTGIGLAICQRIIERYGGSIWVESELGLGSVFRFTIPETSAKLHIHPKPD